MNRRWRRNLPWVAFFVVLVIVLIGSAECQRIRAKQQADQCWARWDELWNKLRDCQRQSDELGLDLEGQRRMLEDCDSP